MNANDQIRAFVREYIDQGKDIDIKLMARLYDGIDVYECLHILQGCNHYAPDLKHFGWKIKELVNVYFQLR